MKNTGEFQLTAMGREEMKLTDGGGMDWREFAVRYLLTEFDDICKGFKDAVDSVDRQYR